MVNSMSKEGVTMDFINEWKGFTIAFPIPCKENENESIELHINPDEPPIIYKCIGSSRMVAPEKTKFYWRQVVEADFDEVT